MKTEFEELVELLKDKNITISTVESFTGGFFAKLITDISGSSQIFYGGIVTYKTSIKSDVLGVDKNIIDKYGVVSQEVANEMAIKGKNMFGTDIVVSFTGNAGPLVCEDNKEVGECYSSILFKDKIYEIPMRFGKLKRNDIRECACIEVASEIIKLIKK